MSQELAARPTAAFVGASWAALLAGCVAYGTGLYNARLPLSEKGFYATVIMFGLFSAVSLQKTVRDRMEGIPTSPLYFGLAWLAVGTSLVLLTVGLWNADLTTSEKGFYAMSFTLSLFAAVTVQKNVRDLAVVEAADGAAAARPTPSPGSTPAESPSLVAEDEMRDGSVVYR